jgi:hypothetical protein
MWVGSVVEVAVGWLGWRCVWERWVVSLRMLLLRAQEMCMG